MKGFILLFYFFSSSIFFCSLSLFSSSYNAGGTTYTFYYAILFMLVIGVAFIYGIQKLTRNQVLIPVTKLFIVYLFIFLLLCVVYGYFHYGTKPSKQIVQYFIAFTTPAVLLALTINGKDIQVFYKYMKYLNIYLTICILATYFRVGSDGFSGIGGASYSLIGYTMAMLFPYNFINLTNSRSFIRKIFYLGMITASLSMILLSGTRGAMVSVVVTFLLMSHEYIIKRKKFLIYTLVFSIPVFAVIAVINHNGNSFGLWRMSLLFNNDFGVTSSGRNVFYGKAISLFKENPIFGSGIGAFTNEFGIYVYPHNIILEILNDFGIIGFIFAGILMVNVIAKSKIMMKQNIENQYMVLLFIQCMVMLMFSGSYLTELRLWIPLVLILTVMNRIKFQKESEEIQKTAQ